MLIVWFDVLNFLDYPFTFKRGLPNHRTSKWLDRRDVSRRRWLQLEWWAPPIQDCEVLCVFSFLSWPKWIWLAGNLFGLPGTTSHSFGLGTASSILPCKHPTPCTHQDILDGSFRMMETHNLESHPSSCTSIFGGKAHTERRRFGCYWHKPDLVDHCRRMGTSRCIHRQDCFSCPQHIPYPTHRCDHHMGSELYI